MYFKIVKHTVTFKAAQFLNDTFSLNQCLKSVIQKNCKQTLEKRQRKMTIQQWIILFSFQQLLKQTSFKAKETCNASPLPTHTHNLCKTTISSFQNLKKKKKKLRLINMKATLLQRDKLKQDKNLFLLNFSFKIQAARRAEN